MELFSFWMKDLFLPSIPPARPVLLLLDATFIPLRARNHSLCCFARCGDRLSTSPYHSCVTASSIPLALVILEFFRNKFRPLSVTVCSGSSNLAKCLSQLLYSKTCRCPDFIGNTSGHQVNWQSPGGSLHSLKWCVWLLHVVC